MQPQKVLIIGGGFAGIRAALSLSRRREFEVTLVSQNPVFEYYPGLHKIVGISEHATPRVPLDDIFSGKGIHLVISRVLSLNPREKTVVTEQEALSADILIIAVGSQTEYFNIQGLKEMAFGFKSVAEACALRRHVESLFQKHTATDKAETVVGLHMVIVGAGPNGVDLAGELSVLGHTLAKKYKITESLMTIDLVEGAPRVLPMMPEPVSHKVEARLRELGVNVLLNRDLHKQESWTVALADMEIGAKTLVWTAGITTNDLVKTVEGFELGKKNRVAVDDHLQAKGFPNVFIVGDAADTPYSGLAQTALYDGEYVADLLIRNSHGKKLLPYAPQPVAYNIGVGPRWSVMVIGKFISYGFLPYVMRTLIDIKFFLSILTPGQVWKLYFGTKEKSS